MLEAMRNTCCSKLTSTKLDDRGVTSTATLSGWSFAWQSYGIVANPGGQGAGIGVLAMPWFNRAPVG